MHPSQSLPYTPFGSRDPRSQWLDVREIIDGALTALARPLQRQRIETIIDVPRNLTLLADREMFCAAVLHLATNAVDAMPDGGRLVVTAFVGQRGLELEVADSGSGLSDEARRRAFEPCFTTKAGAQGLGLSIVRQIAQAHGGDVIAANCPEGGAAFTLRFPARAVSAAA